MGPRVQALTRFTVVVPTISRETLDRCLRSLASQEWLPGDEVLLVGDGKQPGAEALWRRYALPGRYLETPGQLGFWGHGIRNWVNQEGLARGTHLVNLDDDDALRPGAIATCRAVVGDLPTLFRMHLVPKGITLWRTQEISFGNVGTPMLVAPNDRAKLGPWASYYGGDFTFIETTIENFGGVEWSPEILTDVWPARLFPKPRS